ncbi:MAG: leucine-rich repeat domain-containing protein [Holosporales bacterium]|jgi:hypothetical protein|nr:leucine-rich repeat domain-containing protein [Holosporales bacterium]
MSAKSSCAYIPASVEGLNDRCFDKFRNLACIAFESGSLLRRIGDCVFLDCTKLSFMYIQQNVTSLERLCFGRCSDLGNVTFERDSQLKVIGPSVFSACGMPFVHVPENIKRFIDGCFNECGMFSLTFEPNA